MRLTSSPRGRRGLAIALVGGLALLAAGCPSKGKPAPRAPAAVASSPPAAAVDERTACAADTDCADDEDCVDGRCTRGGGGAAAAPCAFEPIFFGFDATTVADASRPALESAAACLQKGGERPVAVVGHTDPRGTEEYNIALSERRAQAVGDFLARLGVDPARFAFVPKGENEATGADEAGWTQDRRVELEWK